MKHTASKISMSICIVADLMMGMAHAAEPDFKNLAQDIALQGQQALLEIQHEQQTDWADSSLHAIQHRLQESEVEFRYASDVDCSQQTSVRIQAAS